MQLSLAQEVIPMLNTKDKKEQCIAFAQWSDLMLLLAGPKLKTGQIVVDTERKLVAPVFSDQVFVKYVGKTYNSLSKSDKSKMRKVINRCAKQEGYQFTSFLHAFQVDERRYYIKDWQDAISKYSQNTGKITRKIAEKEEQDRVNEIAAFKKRTPLRHIIHRQGEVLRTRPGYTIYKYKNDTHDNEEQCGTTPRYKFSVVINDRNQQITKEYINALFENDLNELLFEICSQRPALEAHIFFRDLYLNALAKEFSMDQIPPTSFDNYSPYVNNTEMPLLIASSTNARHNGENFVMTYFIKGEYTPEKEVYFQSVSDLTYIAKQGFKTDAEIFEEQRQIALKANRASDAIRLEWELAGFILEGPGGKGLISGIQPERHFNNNSNLRYDLTSALFGFIGAFTDECFFELPDKFTLVNHSTTKYTLNRRTREKTFENPVEKGSYFLPKAFFELLKYSVEKQDLNIEKAREYGPKTVYYADLVKIIENKGCNSKGVQNFNDNLLTVIDNYERGWPRWVLN